MTWLPPSTPRNWRRSVIDHREVRRAVAEHKEPDCTHPTDQIMDHPDKSYCRKCGQNVPPLMRDSPKSGWRHPSTMPRSGTFLIHNPVVGVAQATWEKQRNGEFLLVIGIWGDRSGKWYPVPDAWRPLAERPALQCSDKCQTCGGSGLLGPQHPCPECEDTLASLIGRSVFPVFPSGE